MNSEPRSFPLVLEPACNFAEIDAAMIGAGFAEVSGGVATQPLVPGEPEFASWHLPDADGSVSYTCNPVIWLRVLRFAGDAALSALSAVRERLSVLDSERLAQLFASANPREQLCGIHAAVELSAFGFMGEIDALRVGPERAVTAAAARAVEQLTLTMLELGADRIESERRKRPDRSALFPRLGDAALRKAVLLELLADGGPADDDTCAVLRAGFVDRDWQVRIAAMLVAVRLKATAVGPALRAIELPTAGLDRRHRSALRVAHKAALAELAALPMLTQVNPRTRLAAAMRNAVAGRACDHSEPLIEWVADFAKLGLGE